MYIIRRYNINTNTWDFYGVEPDMKTVEDRIKHDEYVTELTIIAGNEIVGYYNNSTIYEVVIDSETTVWYRVHT